MPRSFRSVSLAVIIVALWFAGTACTRTLELGLGEADAGGDTATDDGADTDTDDGGPPDSDSDEPDGSADGAIGDGGAD